MNSAARHFSRRLRWTLTPVRQLLLARICQATLWCRILVAAAGSTRHVRFNTSQTDLLRLVVEIKGYRREDDKEKKSTMESLCQVP